MKNKKKESRGTMAKRVISSMLCILLFVLCLPNIANAEEWDVVRGETDYSVSLEKSRNVFICNKGSIGNKVGTEIYMTYTVETMEIQKVHGDGVIGTNQPKARFPCEDSKDGVGGGVLYQSSSNKLLSEGRTYFVKFTITEDGYHYRAGWAEDEKSGYIKLGTAVGNVKSDAQYFGVWFAHEEMTGKLIRD